MNNAGEAKWTTKDELFYLENIGRTIDLSARKKTKKDVLEGYIKGLKKRSKFYGNDLSLDKSHCLKKAYLMLSEIK